MQKRELLRSLDTFTRQYLETALWSETDESTPSGGRPLDDNYGIGDFTVKSLRLAIADCDDFRKLVGEELSQSGFGGIHTRPLFLVKPQWAWGGILG